VPNYIDYSALRIERSAAGICGTGMLTTVLSSECLGGILCDTVCTIEQESTAVARTVRAGPTAENGLDFRKYVIMYVLWQWMRKAAAQDALMLRRPCGHEQSLGLSKTSTSCRPAD